MVRFAEMTNELIGVCLTVTFWEELNALDCLIEDEFREF